MVIAPNEIIRLADSKIMVIETLRAVMGLCDLQKVFTAKEILYFYLFFWSYSTIINQIK